MSEQEPHVRVTLENIYTTLLEMKQQLTAVLTENEARDRRVDDHGNRLAEVEKRQGQLEQDRVSREELDQRLGRQESRVRWAIGIAISGAIGAASVLAAFMRLWTGMP